MPRADDVRPLPVLRDAFALVERRWAAEADYVWAREQLKSIRQDLTVQHLAEGGGGGGGGGTSAARFACKVYEGHARIALQADDLDEFNQCLAQLLPLHARRLQTADVAVCEFAGYRLLRAATRRPGGLAEELHAIVSALSDAQRADGGVRRCLRAAAAVDAHDALRACAAVFSLPHHAAALLRPRLPALRARGLRALCRAFRAVAAARRRRRPPRLCRRRERRRRRGRGRVREVAAPAGRGHPAHGGVGPGARYEGDRRGAPQPRRRIAGVGAGDWAADAQGAARRPQSPAAAGGLRHLGRVGLVESEIRA